MGNGPVLFFKQREVIDIIFENSYWVHLLKIRDNANEINFFFFCSFFIVQYGHSDHAAIVS